MAPFSTICWACQQHSLLPQHFVDSAPLYKYRAFMRLAEWLSKEQIGFAEFGRRIGRTGELISLYVEGRRTPNRKTMERIIKVTSGEVQPNDWYDAA